MISRFLFLVINLLLSLIVLAQNETQALWAGQEYKCDIKSFFNDSKPIDISWEIDDSHKDYFSIEQDDEVCYIKPSRYFSGTAIVSCSFSFILEGSTIEHPPVKWFFTCKDNPVSIFPESLSLEVGKCVQPFQYHHENEDYASEAIVTYEGEGEAIEVTPNGEVKGLQPGVAKVYARSNLSKEKSGPCIVTVTDSQVPEFSISLDKTSMTIEKGQSKALYATVTPSDEEYTIDWSSSNMNVAIVKKDSNNKNKATVISIEKGSTVITATIRGTNKKAECDVTVTITPTSINMPKKNYALYVGEEMTIEPMVKPDGAEYSLSWKSNDSDVAVVDHMTGKVTAKSVGTARITASIVGTNLSDYYDVSVDKPTLIVSASPSGGIVNKATRVTLVANVDGASIWYTLDGSTPKEFSALLYDGPIVINQSVKIKAIATHPDYNTSDVLTQEYVVRTAPGDVNEDRETNIADVDVIIKVILGRNSDQLVYQLADVNNDNEVNIADVSMVIDVILHPEKYRLDVETFIVNGVSFNMVYVEGGSFTMGSNTQPNDELGANNDSSPAHSVTVSSFQMGETEVTQELWEAVMGSNPSYYSENYGYGDTHDWPVEEVSWYDCQTFIAKLNKLTNKNFRLPTEAEWEFAARGGIKGDGHEEISGGGWFFDYDWYEHFPELWQKNYHTKPVGQYKNELGIYDMSGNVSEWCHDWYGSYSDQLQINPIGPITGEERVVRGQWFNAFTEEKGTYREHSSPDSKVCGLRLVLSDVEIFTINDVSFAMIPVKGGTFSMGAVRDDVGAFPWEYPVHQVTLSSYSIGQTEVTQALWNAVMGNYTNPSTFRGDFLPVEHRGASGSGLALGFEVFRGFIDELSSLTGRTFRLPTEAEWEFAARGGNLSHGYIFSGSDNADDVAWTGENSLGSTSPVATKAPNELGLYDMSGNVWEYCLDGFEDYTDTPLINPLFNPDSPNKVIRGGCWFDSSIYGTVSSRLQDMHGKGMIGFRLVLSNENNFDW